MHIQKIGQAVPEESTNTAIQVFYILARLLTMPSIKGKIMPIKNIPVSGPMDAEDRLIVSCNTEPSFSTTNTKPKEKSLLLRTIGYATNLTELYCLVLVLSSGRIRSLVVTTLLTEATACLAS